MLALTLSAILAYTLFLIRLGVYQAQKENT